MTAMALPTTPETATQVAVSGGEASKSPAATPAESSTQGQPQPAKGQEQPAAPSKDGTSDKAAEQKGDQPAKPQGAPDKYDFKASKGGVQFDAQVLDAYSGIAKKLNLTQEGAQELLDTVAPVMHQRQQEQLQTIRTQWAAEALADKDLGAGDKATLDQNLGIAKKALDRFGGPDLVRWLNETGLGNYPPLLKAFLAAGKRISEDQMVPANANGSAKGERPMDNSSVGQRWAAKGPPAKE